MDLQVGVKAFLYNSEHKYLLLKRSEKYKNTKGVWDIVGGRIESNSTLLENLQREIYEETKLRITNPKLIAAQDIFPEHEDRHVVRLTYLAHADGDVVLDTSESSEYKWLSFDELRIQEDLDIYVKDILEHSSFLITH